MIAAVATSKPSNTLLSRFSSRLLPHLDCWINRVSHVVQIMPPLPSFFVFIHLSNTCLYFTCQVDCKSHVFYVLTWSLVHLVEQVFIILFFALCHYTDQIPGIHRTKIAWHSIKLYHISQATSEQPYVGNQRRSIQGARRQLSMGFGWLIFFFSGKRIQCLSPVARR